ncbi:FIST N-terminal domain-containing protein [Amaricoccus macauensis]|uniref:FIST N-terminal domain-containing protein n=1 Tax=Amaricoccus macauensis TaxID=57001 RepID=UPI003C7E232F
MAQLEGAEIAFDGADVGVALDLPAESAVCSACAPADDPRQAFDELVRTLGGAECGLLAIFAAPMADLELLAQLGPEYFPRSQIIGCTTAGEITPKGYSEDSILLVAFKASHVVAETVPILGLAKAEVARAAQEAVRRRAKLAAAAPEWAWEFSFLLIDGMSLREDQVVSALRLGLGGMPFFGGSAGDGLDFGHTYVLVDGVFREDAAVLAVCRSRCRVQVIKFDHFEPTNTKMVVTEAIPDRRIVREINAEPAAREYARLVGVREDELSPFVFSSHPVVVNVGGQHHVRAIQRVEENGDLVFFSAIDEGLVLTLAQAADITDHMRTALANVTLGGEPDAIIGCECLFRRLIAEQTQQTRVISRMLADNRVVGFNTYGEQSGSVHVNQTFTGMAIYPPERSLRD